MRCRLFSDIRHKCEYNSGGISQIFLLDIRDFKTYVFLDDGLYDSCFVEKIKITSPNYVELDVVDGSTFKDSYNKGVYTQTLTTYVRSMEAVKTSGLTLALRNKYLVVFATNTGRMFSFGSDGGVSLNYSHQAGSIGEAEGYNITLTAQSVCPLFEIDSNAMKVYLLGVEDKSKFITSENFRYLFEIEGYEQ